MTPARKKAAGVLFLIVAYAGYRLAAVYFGSVVGKTTAQHDVLSESRALRAPTGFLQTEWLMSQSRVQALRPKARPGNPNTLAEFTEWLDRPAYIVYDFTDDMLLLVTITFTGSSTSDDFARTQKFLSSEYDGIQQPISEAGYVTRSKTKIGRFAVNHALRYFGSTLTEQVQFYRTK